jgi:hypothetical protein
MWPFKNKSTPAFESWPIVRSKPVGKTFGRSISLLINNMQCHLTTVDVYEDGSIECWGFVDLALFEGKLRSNWVVPAPKPGQMLSVFNFGGTGVAAGSWRQSRTSISAEVRSVIKALNPEMRNLLDMHGSDTELRGNVQYAKLGLSDKKPYRIGSTAGGEIFGSMFPILRMDKGTFELTRLTVYADGTCQLGSDDELHTIAGIESLYDANGITNVAPSGSRVVLPGLGEFTTTMAFGGISAHDRLREIHDALNVLNGKDSVITVCARRFEEYERDPSDIGIEALRQAYDAVPTHLRCYCGDMDTRDTAIRAVLYGDDRLL